MTVIILGTRVGGGTRHPPISPIFAHLMPDQSETIPADQLRVVRLVGSPGEGKSKAMRSYFEQCVDQGWGGLLLDPKGSLAEDFVRCTRHLARVIYLAPG